MIRQATSTLLWLIVAAGLQQAVAHRIAIGWGLPDFLLVTAILLSMERSSDGAALTGFAAGLLMGALQNEAMAAYAISRMAASMIAAKIAGNLLDRGPLNVTIVAAVCTLVSGGVYLFVVPFVSPMPNIGGHLADTIGAAIYNAVIAIPTYLLFRRASGAAARV